MVTGIGANRLLNIYGGEVVSYENAISRAFQRLIDLTSFGGSAALPMHEEIRSILGNSGLVSLVFFPQGSSKS